MTTKFSDLLGDIIIKIDVSNNNTQVTFITMKGKKYRMYHQQDCCESVYLYDGADDLQDILDHPILLAEEVTSRENPPEDQFIDSFTWTFYKLATVKGNVTLRWLGESNGYYSESVVFEEVVS